MEFGYCSMRFIQKLCETDIRFLWLLDEEEAPSHMTISSFIKNELCGSLEEIFNDSNSYMFHELMGCPNGKRFHFLRSAPVKGNQFGRTEEYYQCEDCTGCAHREKCHKSEKDRVVRINEELTKFHNEVLNDLNRIHGALLRMNRSIQAEGTFGGIKWNKGYKRLRRRGIEGVIPELRLICCGFNLYKYHLKKLAAQKAA